MNASVIEPWRFLAYGGIFVVACRYVAVSHKLRTARVYAPPRQELFVGFVTLGGWLVTLALLGSSPPIILPIFAFQFLIAIPASIYHLSRLAPKLSFSPYHKTAVCLLLFGILLPLAVYVLFRLFRS